MTSTNPALDMDMDMGMGMGMGMATEVGTVMATTLKCDFSF